MLSRKLVIKLVHYALDKVIKAYYTIFVITKII